MIERAAKMADWLRGTYGYSPEMNAKCVQLLKDMVEEMERLKAECDELKTDMQAVSDASESARKIMSEYEQAKRTMSNDNVNGNVRAILDEIRAFKKEAKEFATSDYRTGYLSALSALEGFIAGLPAVDVLGWISVKDRLPEDVKDGEGYCINYLAYISEYRSVDIANYIEEADMWVCMGVPVNVTHWMLLPELPGEE